MRYHFVSRGLYILDDVCWYFSWRICIWYHYNDTAEYRWIGIWQWEGLIECLFLSNCQLPAYTYHQIRNSMGIYKALLSSNVMWYILKYIMYYILELRFVYSAHVAYSLHLYNWDTSVNTCPWLKSYIVIKPYVGLASRTVSQGNGWGVRLISRCFTFLFICIMCEFNHQIIPQFPCH